MRTATPGNLSKLLPEAVRYQGRTPSLGQKPTFALQNRVSDLPPKADIEHL